MEQVEVRQAVLLSRHSVALETMREGWDVEVVAVPDLRIQRAIQQQLHPEDLVATDTYHSATHT